MLGVDVRAHAAVALRLGHHVHGQRGLPRRLGAEDLNHTASRQAADAQCDVERERAGGDGGDADVAVLPQPHDRALAELLLDLADGHLEGVVVAFHDGTLLVTSLRSCGRGEVPWGATYGWGVTTTSVPLVPLVPLGASGRDPNDTRVT